MPSVVLTDLFIAGLKPRIERQFEIFDRKVPGLSIRVSPQGSKSFSLLYRMGGRNRRLTLGRYPIVRLSEARKRGREAFNQVERGFDPATERVRTRAEYQSRLFPAVLSEFVPGDSDILFGESLDLFMPRIFKAYDKLGYRLLLAKFKKYWFNGGALTKDLCERFFIEEANFVPN